MLLESLPQGGRGIVHFGHKVVSFQQPSPTSVSLTVRYTDESGSEQELEAEGDVLIAADGSASIIRAHYHPGEPRRWAA